MKTILRTDDARENSWPFGPFCMVHIDIQGKDRPSFLTDVVHMKPKSSILTFTEKGEKKISMIRGNFGTHFYGLSTSSFKLSLLSLSVSKTVYTLESLFAHFHSQYFFFFFGDSFNLVLNYSRKDSEFLFSPTLFYLLTYPLPQANFKASLGSCIQYPVLVLESF